ncbi:hypothetical protein RhiirA5_421023 [Rhizophagus irregularis]|uniref:Uncharacterized protein n=1 Tax=Rhizophagus irregularis TaxID=588596 RepID=A0A2N0SIM8_9GLOM|nr:hypothetical protein RhiirA5_421023 [Rhizophagus irregularis]PKC75410.1 hypothetical protein RhiirA1_448789 [Rhizophagus irregularis]CAG8678837.1 11_t:CDS:2 [Rhizophagus irregularis]
MSESANLTSFICKWLGTHSDPQHLETEEKLRNHIIQHDINSCKRSISGDSIYICPWKGCNKYQSSIIKLEGIKICQRCRLTDDENEKLNLEKVKDKKRCLCEERDEK